MSYNGSKERKDLQLNDLNVFVLAIFPTLLNLLKPLGFFYTNLAHMVQHLA